jgi:hypothetical protein
MARINQIYVVIEYIYSSYSEYKADLEKYTDDFSLVKDDGYVNEMMGYRLRVKQ